MMRKSVLMKIFNRRKNTFLLLPFLVAVMVIGHGCWWFAELTSRALMPPPPPDQNLDHFRRNRNLQHYLNNIQVLIEPSSAPCTGLDEVPVIILVTSTPLHFDNRAVIRRTWAKHQPTYFVMGLQGNNVDENLVDNYVEAKQYRDLVVFDFHDHYQNLTLKTALMMRWTLERCPQAQFMMKTDDDVLVNPWMLKTVLTENQDAQLLGYSFNGTQLHRDEYSKWYVPRWICSEDRISAYLTGPAYLVSGEHLRKLIKAAYHLPLVNVEDVFFTYLVAKKTLALGLSHDSRLSPYKPWVPFSCAYWNLASAHSLKPEEMAAVWAKLEALAKNENACSFFNLFLLSNWFLY